MPLEDFLMPGENIRYRSPTPVEYQGDTYEFHITDRRLLWYKRAGLIFKSDKIITESIGDVVEIKYEERGILSKKGVIQIVTSRKPLAFSGSREAIRAIYSELQTYLAPTPRTPPQVSVAMPVERYCPSCGGELKEGNAYCSFCGRKVG